MNTAQETIKVLNNLVEMGFDEDAFQCLHHMGTHSTDYSSKTSIQQHLDYCKDGKAFKAGGTNEAVFRRLQFVHDTYLAMNIANGNLRVFRALAGAAYFGIGPVTNR